jgi:3-(3-hydroxy-phenyl)propionate hydroxylase
MPRAQARQQRPPVAAVHLSRSRLNTPDRAGEVFSGVVVPGAPAADAPVESAGGRWLLDHLREGFTLLVFGGTISNQAAEALAHDPIPCGVLRVGTGAGRPG